MSKILDKGAIPRITQEIYYTANKKGEVRIDRTLTLKKFDKKLEELKNRQEK